MSAETVRFPSICSNPSGIGKGHIRTPVKAKACNACVKLLFAISLLCDKDRFSFLPDTIRPGAFMPYNAKLAERVDTAVLKWSEIEKKGMFGGICYLVDGNMCFGVYKDYLIVRMDAELAAEKLKSKNVRAFDITGRPMKGWVMVRKNALDGARELDGWLSVGRSYARTLPPKPARKKSLEDIYYRSNRA